MTAFLSRRFSHTLHVQLGNAVSLAMPLTGTGLKVYKANEKLAYVGMASVTTVHILIRQLTTNSL